MWALDWIKHTIYCWLVSVDSLSGFTSLNGFNRWVVGCTDILMDGLTSSFEILTTVCQTTQPHISEDSLPFSNFIAFEEEYVLALICNSKEARGRAVGWGTMQQAGRSRLRVSMRWIFFSIYLIFQPHYGSGDDSPCNRKEYQETSWKIKSGRRVRLTTLPPSVSRLSKENVGASTSYIPMDFTAWYRDIFTFNLQWNCDLMSPACDVAISNSDWRM
jgi:hypothetical protein